MSPELFAVYFTSWAVVIACLAWGVVQVLDLWLDARRRRR